MKWLVKTLDALLPYTVEEESKDDQIKLEKLISRYKNLIPTIEVTMVRTEVFSKCYTYRREVSEIVNLLNKVRDQTLATPQPDSLGHATKMVEDQQYAMAQLDLQRPNIVSMLQRGKDLSNDSNAPVFMTAEVTVLERGWKDTYNKSAEKLRELKDTRQAWTDYATKKDEIIQLISKTETALRSITPLQTDPLNVSKDLKEKVELRDHLDAHAQNLIDNLKQTSTQLIPLTPENRHTDIEKDVTELQKKFTNTLNHVQNRVVYLEDYNQKWSNYKIRLAELQAWANQTAPTLVKSLQSLELTAEEKKEKQINIQRILHEKMRQLEILTNDAIELSPKEGNVEEAKRLKAEVVQLREIFQTVHKDFITKSDSVTQHLNDYQQYQAELKEIRPRIETFEIKISTVVPKAVSIQEAVQQQQEARKLESEFEQNIAKLENVNKMAILISEATNIPDDLDSLRSKFNGLYESAKQSRVKQDKLVKNWQTFDGDATKLENWISDSEKLLHKRPNLANCLQVDKLEKELSRLKSLNNDVSEHQSKLLSITQSSDMIVSGIDPAAADIIRNRVKELKVRITNMTDSIRSKINETMDQILINHDFNSKIVDFSDWLSQMQTKNSVTDEITEDKIPYNLQITHQLLQDSSEKKPFFNDIYNNVKDMLLNSSPEENQNLNELYTGLVTDYQKLDENLEGKRKALEKWSELISFVNESQKNLEHIKKQLDKTDHKQVSKLKESLDSLRQLNNCAEEYLHYSPNELAALQIKDNMGRSYLTYPNIITNLKFNIEELSHTANDLLDHALKQAKNKEFHDSLQNKFTTILADVRTMLENVESEPNNMENIELKLIKLTDISDLLNNQINLRNDFRKSANQLMAQNVNESRSVLESLSCLDREWENLGHEITRRLDKYKNLKHGVENFNAAKEKLKNELTISRQNLDGLTLYNEEHPVSANAIEELRPIKCILDDFANKGAELIELLDPSQDRESIECDLNFARDQYENLQNAVQNCHEAKSAEARLLRQIKLMKDDILPWIECTSANLGSAMDNVHLLENCSSKINKFNNEIPHYKKMRDDIARQIQELRELKSGNILSMEQLVNEIDTGLNDLYPKCQQLQETTSMFHTKENELRGNIKILGDNLNKIRESLLKCDDMTGEPNNIINRIIICDSLKEDLQNCTYKIHDLLDQSKNFLANHPALTDWVVSREIDNLARRQESIQKSGNNIKQTLVKFSKKHNQDRLDMLSRLLEAQTEKLQFCQPEAGSDKYNLEVKRGALVDVNRSIKDIRNRHDELGPTLLSLQEAVNDEDLSAIVANHVNLTSNLDQLERNYAQTENRLLINIELWEAYEKNIDKINESIREVELLIKDQPNYNDMSNSTKSLEYLQEIKQKLNKLAVDLKTIEDEGTILNDYNPDSRPLQYFHQTSKKFDHLNKGVEGNLLKIAELQQLQHQYDTGMQHCTVWINGVTLEIQSILNSIELKAPEKVEKLKNIFVDITDGAQQINTLSTDGENLCAMLAPNNRESIRKGSASVQEQLRALCENVKYHLQNIETQIGESNSIVDNIEQVNFWLDEFRKQNPDAITVGSNLTEKANHLQKYKLHGQDIELQKQMLLQVQERANKLGESELHNKAMDIYNEIKLLEDQNKFNISTCQEQIDHHNQYDKLFENLNDWFTAIKNVGSDLSTKQSYEDTVKFLQSIIDQEDKGNRLVEECKAQLSVVLPETNNGGQAVLNQIMDEFIAAKNTYFEAMKLGLIEASTNLMQMNANLEELENCEKTVKDLEIELKDQQLQSTLENKERNLTHLMDIYSRLTDETDRVGVLNSELTHYEVDPEILLKCSRLNTRCATLKNICKEFINKYEIYTKDHREFEKLYTQSALKISDAFDKLAPNKELIGDLEVLQTRHGLIKDLQDQQLIDNIDIEDVLSKGENLYAQTSPEGREIIRQQLESLKTDWDRYTCDCNEALQLLENCLKKFGDFAVSQEQLSKWLRDIDSSLASHMELKSTLQEKKAQLLHHQLLHQEIKSRETLVDNMCENAKQLINQTTNNAMESVFLSIKELFDNVVAKSDSLLNNLMNAVEMHSDFENQDNATRLWLNNNMVTLGDLDHNFGEKEDIIRRLSKTLELKNDLPKGHRLITRLKDCAAKVMNTTSATGTQTIQEGINLLENKMNGYESKLAETDTVLNDLSTQWDTFDREMESITKTCRELETIFKGDHLQPSLSGKQEMLTELKSQKDKANELQHKMDHLMEISNKFYSVSNADRVRNLSNQLSNRIQLLNILSKEVVNRWTNIVNDHMAYEKSFENALNLINQAEAKLHTLEDISRADENISKLLCDQDYIENVLNGAHSLGETLMSDTLAEGRENIRKGLRELNDRWDKIKETLKDIKNNEELQTGKLQHCKDIIHQVSSWLDGIERSLDRETSMPYTTLPEIRMKSIKLQTMLQDINGHKRILDLAFENANHFKKTPSTVDALSELEVINERYNYVRSSCSDLIDKLHRATEIYEQFYALHKEAQDHLKDFWDSLSSCSDAMGNADVLQTRLEKVTELDESLSKGDDAFKVLENHISENADIISPRSQENMTRDIFNLKTDFQKCKNSLSDIKTTLLRKLEQWSEFDNNLEQLATKVSEAEIKIKSYCLKSTLAEKQELLNDFKDLAKTLKSQDFDLAQLKEDSLKFLPNSGDLRMNLHLQQVVSRHQVIQSTVKEILKKCENAVLDHEHFDGKYKQCSMWLSNTQAELLSLGSSENSLSNSEYSKQLDKANQMLSEQPQVTLLINTVYDACSNACVTTATEGREIIQHQHKELQAAIESLFDKINIFARTVQNKINQCGGFEISARNLECDLNMLKEQLSDTMILKPTLDEKRQQLQHYRDFNNIILAKQPQIIELKNKIDAIPTEMSDLKLQYEGLVESLRTLSADSKKYTEMYIDIVNHHQQLKDNIDCFNDYILTSEAFIEPLLDSMVDQISLRANLERLTVALNDHDKEKSGVDKIQTLADQVVLETRDDGHNFLRHAVDDVLSSWEKLQIKISTGIQTIELKILQWDGFERIRDDCMSWITTINNKLYSMDLKETKADKIRQLEEIQEFQGEIRAKELEIDNLIEKSQSLLTNAGRLPTADILPKYQQLVNKVKDLNTRWQNHVSSHQQYDTKLSECQVWLDSLKTQIAHCAKNSPRDLGEKLKIIQEVVLQKDTGFSRIQDVIECAQTVLANTAPPGHAIINKDLAQLQDDWASVSVDLIDVKQSLDENIQIVSGLTEQLKRIDTQVIDMEKNVGELSKLQHGLPEKRANIEKIKSVLEKNTNEKENFDNLKNIVDKTQCFDDESSTLQRFEVTIKALEKLLREREDQYRDHRLYKEAFDDLVTWLTRAKDKFPYMKQQMLNDKMVIENGLTPLESLLNKQPQGELMLEHLINTSEIVLPNTSDSGRDLIQREILHIQKEFSDFFSDIQLQKDNLEGTIQLWRIFKDEYERLSEWLQQIDILTKNHKLNLCPTLSEKQKQLLNMKDVLDRLLRGQVDIDKFNEQSAPLLASHIESYVAGQLNQLNSKYQVALNLGKDVYNRIECNFNQHEEFNDKLKNARNWIESANEKLKEAGEITIGGGSKDRLEKCLNDIKILLENRDEGQLLVHSAVNLGEKILRTTRSDGKESLTAQIHDLQSDWDRLVKKMAGAKVTLETNLLQWADYSSSYSQLEKWIEEREIKLQEATDRKVKKPEKGQPLASGLSERKAHLRQTNNIVQDIVSFEPMIQSVSLKATDLKQGTPAIKITEKYENLSKQAKDLYEKEKETVDCHQALIDAGNSFAQWLRCAKEKLSKCMDATGDQGILSGKLNQIRIISSEVDSEGVPKLNKVLEQGEIACHNAAPIDREIIEEEVALLQEEFDHFNDNVDRCKVKLECAIIQWNDYEASYCKAEQWLINTEGLVQSYNTLQYNLEEKRKALEQFQNHLQDIFDWQSILDNLNRNAQTLLETCSNALVSNGITQLTTKYNAILSMSKDVIRRLELHYQEHQQHQSLYGECQDWIEDIKSKLVNFQLPNTVREIKMKLANVVSLKQLLEQGQNKLRYTIELKEKVIMNTEINGATKIQEDTDNLKLEFDKLSKDIDAIKQSLTDRLAQLEDVEKLLKTLNEYLSDIDPQILPIENNQSLNELSEKRTLLEKYKAHLGVLEGFSETTDKIKAKLIEESQMDKMELDETLKKYSDIHTRIINNIENLNDVVECHQNFRKAVADVKEWIHSTKSNLQQHCNVNGSKNELLEKQTKLESISLSLPEGRILLENCIVLSTLVISSSGPNGQQAATEDIKHIKSEWEALQYILKQFEDNLSNCLKSWNNFLTMLDSVKEWLAEFENKVDAMQADPQRWTNDILSCKVRHNSYCSCTISIFGLKNVH